jgi:hypothetical protein
VAAGAAFVSRSSARYHAGMPGCAIRRCTAAGLLAGAALLASACAGTQPASSAAGQSASASPGASRAPAAMTPSERRALAARYLAIARPANHRLDVDFDGGLEGHDRNNLRAADADLRNAAMVERLFDSRLLRIDFPPGAETAVRELYVVNQARASLTSLAATSASLHQLRRFERWLDDANGPVEQQVRLIRRDLGLPPPETS